MRIKTQVTWLKMKEKPPQTEHKTCGRGFELKIVKLTQPTVEDYRFLYNTVGAPWTWIERRLFTDQKLLKTITHPNVEIYTLSSDDEIAGFSEIKRSNKLHQAEIKYFGLMPSFIGRRLGRYFLMKIIDLAWAGATKRVTVNTCDLDHPRAIDLYTSCGFEITKKSIEFLPDPTKVGLPIPRKRG